MLLCNFYFLYLISTLFPLPFLKLQWVLWQSVYLAYKALGFILNTANKMKQAEHRHTSY